MVKWPTSLFPISPAGRPTAKPLASTVRYSPLVSASITGVSAFFMALPIYNQSKYINVLVVLRGVYSTFYILSKGINILQTITVSVPIQWVLPRWAERWLKLAKNVALFPLLVVVLKFDGWVNHSRPMSVFALDMWVASCSYPPNFPNPIISNHKICVYKLAGW